MQQFIILAIVGLIGIFIGRQFATRRKMQRGGSERPRGLGSGSLAKANAAREMRKEDAKKKILELFSQKDKITNNDVEKLLGVSDATATRYLDELEKDGKIVQKGEAGRGIFYIQK